MKLVDKLTAQPKQKYNLIGYQGESIAFELEYMPTQEGWKFNVNDGEFILNGALLTISPNILRNYKNIINYGISVVSTDGFDPATLDDFTSGRVQIYLLSPEEVAGVEAFYFT